MPKVLLISYVFPPGGGAGVQRAVKFVKYLPQWGWDPVVVAAGAKSVPVKDSSLADDLPRDIPVYRLRTLEPSAGPAAPAGAGNPGLKAKCKRLALNLLFPDRHILWLPTALPGALAAARRHKVDMVLATAPPFSVLYLGALVAKLTKKPLALDFRDDWGHAFGVRNVGDLWSGAVKAGERRLVRMADLVIGNTPTITGNMIAEHGGGALFASIRNGYDPDDFAGLEAAFPQEKPAYKHHILYTGTVYEGAPLKYFWEGMARLPESLRQKLWVEVVGRVVPGHVADPKLPGLEVKVRPYEPHHRVLRRMLGADGLLLTLGADPGETTVVPAKTYEYLAARRPIFAVVPPQGEAGRLVHRHASAMVTSPDDPQGIAEAMTRWLQNPPPAGTRPPLQFDRRYQTGKLAELMYEAVMASGKG